MKKINIVIGDPINHSLSPLIHNEWYRMLGISDEYTFHKQQVKPQNLKSFLLAKKYNGLAITIPHKQSSIEHMDNTSEISKVVGSINTVTFRNGKLFGDNTDWYGTFKPLYDLDIDFRGKKLALIGAGGAARGMYFACLLLGFNITIFNRTITKAQEVVSDISSNLQGENKLFYEVQKILKIMNIDDFSLNKDLITTANTKVLALSEIDKKDDYDVIINSTSIGMQASDKSLIPETIISKDQIIFDAVYGAHRTKLQAQSEKVGLTFINGLSMLIYQATLQFYLHTERLVLEHQIEKVFEKIRRR